MLDLATGKFYQFPTGKTEEIQLYGYEGTHKVDARTAARLSLLAANNDPAYHDWAKRVVATFRDNPSSGVLTLDGKMLDRPHLVLAERLLARAGE